MIGPVCWEHWNCRESCGHISCYEIEAANVDRAQYVALVFVTNSAGFDALFGKLEE